ncbi:MAG: hypothetical protein KBT34_02935 [Prevotella sp.]|nr:hypothetical protein [Candidatus Prevotella equi]
MAQADIDGFRINIDDTLASDIQKVDKALAGIAASGEKAATAINSFAHAVNGIDLNTIQNTKNLATAFGDIKSSLDGMKKKTLSDMATSLSSISKSMNTMQSDKLRTMFSDAESPAAKIFELVNNMAVVINGLQSRSLSKALSEVANTPIDSEGKQKGSRNTVPLKGKFESDSDFNSQMETLRRKIVEYFQSHPIPVKLDDRVNLEGFVQVRKDLEKMFKNISVTLKTTEIGEKGTRKTKEKTATSVENVPVVDNADKKALDEVNEKLRTQIALLREKRNAMQGSIRSTGTGDFFIQGDIDSITKKIEELYKARHELLTKIRGVSYDESIAKANQTELELIKNIEKEGTARQQNIAWLTQMRSLLENILTRGQGVDMFSGMQQHIVDARGELEKLLKEQRTTTEQKNDRWYKEGVQYYDNLAKSRQKTDEELDKALAKADANREKRSEDLYYAEMQRLKSLYAERLRLEKELQTLSNKETLSKKTEGKTPALTQDEIALTQKLREQIAYNRSQIAEVISIYGRQEDVARAYYSYEVGALRQKIELTEKYNKLLEKATTPKTTTTSTDTSNKEVDMQRLKKLYSDRLRLEKELAGLNNKQDLSVKTNGQTPALTQEEINLQEKLKAQLSATRNEIAQIIGEYGRQKSVAKTYHSYEIEALRQKIALSEKYNSTLAKAQSGTSAPTISPIQAQINELNAAATTKLTSLQQEMNQYSASITLLSSKIAELQAQTSFFEQKNREEYDKTNAKIRENEELLQLAKQQIAEYQAKMSASSDKFERAAYQSGIEGWTKGIQRIEAENKTLIEKLNTIATNDQQARQNAISQMQGQIAGENLLYQTTLDQIEKVKKENDDMIARLKRIEEIKGLLKEVEDEYRKLVLLGEAVNSEGKTSAEAKALIERKQGYEQELGLLQRNIAEAEKMAQAEELTNAQIKQMQNEYARLLVEIDKVTASRQKMRDLRDSSEWGSEIRSKMISGISNANTELDKLEERKKYIEEKLEDELDKIKATHERKRAEQSLKDFEDAEKKKTEAAKKAARERADEEKRQSQAKSDWLKKQAEYTEQYRQTSLGASLFGKSALTSGTYNDTTKALKYLQTAMANVKPNTEEWNKMNTIYQQLKRNADEYRKAMEGVKTQSLNLIPTLNNLAMQVGLVFSVQQVRQWIKHMAEVRAQFELQNIALQSILANKAEGDRIFSQVQQLALKSPFSIMQLTTYTKQMAAYQIESEKLVDTTKRLADVSAGLGVDMGRLILAYGQVKSANYLRATEVRQFTEAGLNISQELAKYFSELKGEMVSVADVTDMITKRMVMFEDVEEVFRRITSAGGMFYNMQEKQAEGLAGQIQRISDAYAMALNDIGKSNQGLLSLVLTLARVLLNNWRILENMGIGVAAAFATYAVKATLAARANNTFNASATGVVGSIFKMKTALVSVGNFIKNNWSLVVVAGVTAAAAALWDFGKSIYQIEKRYSDFNSGIASQSEAFNKIRYNIETNNSLINIYGNYLKDASKGTSEYSSALLKMQKAVASNNTSVQELINKFPFLRSQIEQSKDGIIDLVKVQEAFNEMQGLQQYINTKQDDSHFFSDDIIEDMQEYSEYMDKLNAKLVDHRAEISATVVEMQQWAAEQKNIGVNGDDAQEVQKLATLWGDVVTYINRAKEAGASNTEIYSHIYNEYVKINKEVENYAKKQGGINSELSRYSSELIEQLLEMSNAYKETIQGGTSILDWQNHVSEVDKEVNKLFDSIATYYGTTTDKLKKLTDDQKKMATEAARHWFQEHKLALDDYQVELLNRKWQITVGVKFKEDDVSGDLDFLQKQINNYVSSHSLLSVDASFNLRDKEKSDDYFKRLNANVKDLEQQINSTSRATAQLNEGISNKEKVKELQKQKDETIALLKYFGQYEDKTKGGDKTEELMRKRIDLIKKANSEYEKMSKEMDKVNARNRVLNAFVKEAKTLGIEDIFKADMFDDKSTLSAMQKVEQRFAATLANQKYIGAKRYVEEQIGEAELNVFVSVNKESRERVKREMDEMFGSYELFVELDKMGVKTDVAQALFGNLTNSLDAVESSWKQKFVSMMDEQYRQMDANFVGFKSYEEAKQKVAEDNLNENLKLAEDMEKKITDARNKELQTRLKDYTKYLKSAYSEAVNVEVNAYKELAQQETDREALVLKVKVNPELSQTEKDAAIKNINAQFASMRLALQKETNNKLGEIKFKEFKENPIFVELFGDLDTLGKKVIDMLIKKIHDLKSEIGSLDPKLIKELTQYETKLFEARAEKNPFGEYISALKEIHKLHKQGLNKEKLEEQLISQEAERQAAQDQYNMYSKMLAIKEGLIKVDGKLSTEEQAILKYSSEKIQKYLNTAEETLNTKTGLVQKTQDQLSAYEKAVIAANKASKRLQDISQLTSGAFGALNEGIRLFGGSLSDADQAWMDFAEQAISSTIQLIAQMVLLGVAVNEAAGIIGIIATALTVVAGLFKAIFNAHEAKLQEQIEDMQRQVDKLQRSFDDLKDSIDNAFSSAALSAGMDAAIRNLEEQNRQYERMIRLEREKKDADEDKIQGYLNAIDDNKKKMKELQEDYITNLGGFGSGSDVAQAAQSFVDAWTDAFGETAEGLSGLQDTFDDYIKNIMKKQAYLKAAEFWIKPLTDKINSAFNKYGGVDFNQLKATYEEFKNNGMIQMDAFMEDFTKMFEDLFGMSWGDSASQLSGLAAGIQGVTEETAQVLEALLNSMRFYVADSNKDLKTIMLTLTNPPSDNVFLSELKAQTAQLEMLNKTLNGLVRAGHRMGGHGLKVFTN